MNDSPPGGVLTATLVAPATSGQAVLAPDGSFTYTPNAGFVGVDTFTYRATDTTSTLASQPASVTITVTDPTAPPSALPANRSQFVPVAPTRIVDTRSGLGAATGPVGAGSNTVITAVGKAGIPAGATGVVVNITAADGAAGGYLQAFPTGAPVAGAASNVNIDHGSTNGRRPRPRRTGRRWEVHDLLVQADTTGGSTCLATSSQRLRLEQDGSCRRILCACWITRSGVGAAGPVAAGGSVVLNLANRIPADAGAVVMTLTATRSQAPGWVQAIPTGGATALGASSNVNIDRAGDSTANTVIVPVSAGGNVTLFSSIGTDLVADVVGYFTGASAVAATTGLFVPVVPERLADSRAAGTDRGQRTRRSRCRSQVGQNLPDPPPDRDRGDADRYRDVGRRIRPGIPDGRDDRSRIDVDAELERSLAARRRWPRSSVLPAAR